MTSSSAAASNHRTASSGGGGGTKEEAIDRQKQCPFLLRVFVSNSRHNPMKDYNRGNTPHNELQIYTWMDASLKELTALVREVNADSRRRGTYFDVGRVHSVHPKDCPTHAIQRFRVDNCDFNLKKLGTTVAGIRGVDDQKTLRDVGFVIGDYLDIAVSPPPSGGLVGGGPRGGGPDRGPRGFGDRGGERRGGFGRGRDRDNRGPRRPY